MAVTIRPAEPSDAARLAELRWEFRAGRDAPVHAAEAFAAGHEPREAFLRRCAAWMTRELESSDGWRAWVAEDRAQIVGQVWLYTIQKVPNPIGEPDRHAYLSNLYVTPAVRGGVGTRLLEAALAHAATAGVDRIVLWPSDRSRSLYLRYGFAPSGGVMELTVSTRR